MNMTDPISDFLTRIRNAQAAGHKTVDIPTSGIKREITRVLHEQGYIRKYKFIEAKPQGVIKIALKYDRQNKQPAMQKIERISKPGLRKYSAARDLPNVLNGLGVAIISTPKGVMTGKEARRLNVGGEILCEIH